MNLSAYVRWVTGTQGGTARQQLHPSTVRRANALAVAMHLPVLLWLATSFIVADRLCSLNLAGAMGVALFCAGLIFSVERLVIIGPKSKLIATVRIALGLTIAVLGATVTDILVFEREILARVEADARARTEEQLNRHLVQKRAEAQEKKALWLTAQAKAQCEADGTCGSRIRAIGPVYQELAAHGERLQRAAAAAEQKVATLEEDLVRARQAPFDLDPSRLGLLTRVVALHRFLESDLHALAIYALFFILVCLTELMGVLTKFSFGPTVDDEIDTIRESISRRAAMDYQELIESGEWGAKVAVERAF